MAEEYSAYDMWVKGIMKTTIYYLSAAGNSFYTARFIQRRLAASRQTAELISMRNALQARQLSPEGNAGIVMPLHFFGVPLLAEEFLAQLDLTKANYTFAVMTCGWHYMSDAVHSLRKIFAAKGKELAAAFYVDMVSIYLPLGDIPPEEKKLQRLEKAKQRMEIVADYIVQQRTGFDHEYLNGISSLIHGYVRCHRQQLDKDFHVTEQCNHCGLCTKICPVNNITLTAEGPDWQHRCTQCLACLHACPQKAIELGQKTVGKQRYRHPEVEARELFFAGYLHT